MSRHMHIGAHITKAVLCGAIVGTLLSRATPAHASETKDYWGAYCIPASGNFANADDTRMQNTMGQGVQNTSGSVSLNITCPILKTTSNTSITSGDQITAVSVNVTGGSSTTVTCTVHVWDISLASNGSFPANVASDESTPFSNASSPSNSSASLSVTNVSGAHGYFSRSGSHPEWYYAEMTCTLSPGTTLDTYHVTEAGTAQAAIIYPSSWCTPNWTNNQKYHSGSSGYIECADSSVANDVFSWYCPIQSWGAVDFAIGPAFNSLNTVQCTNDTTSSVQSIGNNSNETPFVDFVWTDQMDIGVDCVQTTTASSHVLTGDGKIVSARTH